MNYKFVVFALLVVGCFLPSGIEGTNMLTIDSFVTGGSASSIIYEVPDHTGVPYTWYSPYFYIASPGDPQVKYFTTSNCIGGQRDLVLGYTTDTPSQSVAIMNIVSRTGSIAFPLGWIGGAYFQWDGVDNVGTDAFPGAALNPNLPVSLDATFGGTALGFALSITTDQRTDYRIRVIDSFDNINTYQFFIGPFESGFLFNPVLFSDPNWDTPGFDFTDIRGIEVNIQTGTGAQSNAPDTQFTELFIFTFAIFGNVGIRCNCGLSGVDAVIEGDQIDLLQSGVTIDTTLTDINGDYAFWALDAGTYTVCYHDVTVELCTGFQRCETLVIDPITPDVDYFVDFVLTQPVVFEIPPDVEGDCSDCTIPDPLNLDPSCPDFATTTGCLGGTTIVTEYEDITIETTCSTFITRTWISPDDGTRLTQFLTYTDTTDPFFIIPPQDINQDCDDIITSLVDWIAADAFSTYFDDCTIPFVSNDWDGFPVGPCDSLDVTFVVNDACAHSSAPAVATFTLNDFFDPIIDQGAQDLLLECDAKSFFVESSYNSWISNRANAQAHDDCSVISWTNDSLQQLPLDFDACFDEITVTFTAHDSCNNVASTTAVFTVIDSTPAIFIISPSNFVHDCIGSPFDEESFDDWLTSGGYSVYTDACSVTDLDITLSNDYDVNTVLDPCGDSVFVTFFINDFCGNIASSAGATYTIRDNTSPVVVSPALDEVVECDGFGNFDDFDEWLLNNAGFVAVDDCTTVIYDNNAFLPPLSTCLDSVVVTFSADDLCGRGITDQAQFTIIDTVAPAFDLLPVDSGSECDDGADLLYADWLANNAGATAIDNCSLTVTITNAPPNLQLGCDRDNVVPFIATDDCLNQSETEFATFTITDSQAPVIISNGADLDLECNRSTNQNDYNNWLATQAGADAIDECTSVSWTHDGTTTLVPSCFFTRDVIFTANDLCGNSDSITRTVVISDNAPPVLDFVAIDQDIQCDIINNPTSNQQYLTWIANHGFAAAHDDCTVISWSDDHVGLFGIDSCFASETVTFIASDACAGNDVITTATFTVRDTTPPVIITPAQTTTVQCDPNANNNQFLTWVQNHGGAVIVDSCSQITWGATVVPTPVGCGSVDVTFTADDGCGSIVSTTAEFTIIDTVPPTLSPAQNVQFQCDGTGNILDYQNYLATRGGATAQDVCTTSITWSNTAIGTGPVGCGSETITFTAVDACNQRQSTTGTFTIIDTFSPSIFPPAADQSAECDSNGNSVAIATWLLSRGGAQATDSCYSTESLTWTNNFTSLTLLPCGAITTVTFTVRDPCANTASTTASFTVTDSVPPVFTRQATPLVLECNADTNNADTLTWVNTRASASATDACSSVTYTNNFVATPDPCSGAHVVEFYATDVCGNRAISTASVTIQDTVPPEFVNFPQDIKVVCDEITDSSVTGIPLFIDNCITADVIRTEEDTIEVLPFERLCPGDSIITRTWRLTDACGNIAERDQIIIVSIPQGPCIPQPCIPCEDQPLLCCASSIAPVPCNPVPCTPVDCTHASCSTVPCLPVVCSNGSPPPFEDDDDTIAPSPRPQPSECEPIYIYVFDDDDGVTSQPVYTVTFNSNSDASTLSYSLLFSLLIAFFIFM